MKDAANLQKCKCRRTEVTAATRIEPDAVITHVIAPSHNYIETLGSFYSPDLGGSIFLSSGVSLDELQASMFRSALTLKRSLPCIVFSKREFHPLSSSRTHLPNHGSLSGGWTMPNAYDLIPVVVEQSVRNTK